MADFFQMNATFALLSLTGIILPPELKPAPIIRASDPHLNPTTRSSAPPREPGQQQQHAPIASTSLSDQTPPAPIPFAVPTLPTQLPAKLRDPLSLQPGSSWTGSGIGSDDTGGGDGGSVPATSGPAAENAEFEALIDSVLSWEVSVSVRPLYSLFLVCGLDIKS